MTPDEFAHELARLEQAGREAFDRDDPAAFWGANFAARRLIDEMSAILATEVVAAAEKILLDDLYERDPAEYWRHAAETLRAERKARMRRVDGHAG